MASQTNLLPLVLLLCYVGLGSVYAFHLIKYSAGHIRSRGSYGAIDEQQQRGLWNHQTEATKRWSSTSTVDSEQEQIQISPENADRLQSYFSFPLDRWQLEAGEVLCNNASCIVCAPTGAGKTVVGEMALHLAFAQGKNAIYTTPLKALSNQKFFELRKIFGVDAVGLSTGDISINRGARITVMTTEVYRNMAWRESAEDGSDLALNAVVVLDEFHYMGQPGRGGVWEECVITSPNHTQIVGLSATLPNADALAGWMQSVTNRKTVLVEAGGLRPVPLRYLYASSDGLMPLFQNPDAGPGSPRGLLGFRGDGIAEASFIKKGKKRKGFSDKLAAENVGTAIGIDVLPRGLKVNQDIKKATQKRQNKVDRAIKRKTLEREESNRQRKNTKRDNDDWDMPLRNRDLSQRELRRERERMLKREMRKSVPSLPFILQRLNQKNLLPAIFFIFSRAGCDEAAQIICNQLLSKALTSVGPADSADRTGSRKTRQRGKRNAEASSVIRDAKGRSFRKNGNRMSDETMNSIMGAAGEEIMKIATEDGDSIYHESNLSVYAEHGLLDLPATQETASRILAFNNGNPEIPIEDEKAIRYMLGVGSHHAGMLPAHKTLIEILFRNQLMKVIFATETLAAGINMPARTTVICSMAKRQNGGGMGLLMTSNLLQIAGRAGRRGMDIAGTCVLVATPFEGADEAALILTNEIERIRSQFSPSYSLAVNLVARGDGKLGVARELVGKSFAVWEKNQFEQSLVQSLGEDIPEGVLQAVSAYDFISLLQNHLSAQLDECRAEIRNKNKDGIFLPATIASSLEEILMILTNDQALKKCSKAYTAEVRMLEMEEQTLSYLLNEEEESKVLGADIGDLFDVDEQGVSSDAYLSSQIETQKKRIGQSRKAISEHMFTSLASMVNTLVAQSEPETAGLQSALVEARRGEIFNSDVTADEISSYIKAISSKRTKQVIKRVNKGRELISDDEVDYQESDSWEDMKSLINVLEAFGCLRRSAAEDEDTFIVSDAGEDVGMLNFDNSLWGLVAMGGAWDIAGASTDLDSFSSSLDDFFEENFTEKRQPSYGMDENDTSRDNACADVEKKPQTEASDLISNLLELSPSEMAGYVSCLVADESRKADATSLMDTFGNLPPAQRRVLESASLAAERLLEVQTKFPIDEGSSSCRLELGTCNVVTEWADGCTWNEALEMSGSAPGDLVRVLQRGLDALRQFGNLPYHPIRATDGTIIDECPGIHPDIRKLCRDAATQMDRYPIKDILSFPSEDDESNTEDDELSNMEEEGNSISPPDES